MTISAGKETFPLLTPQRGSPVTPWKMFSHNLISHSVMVKKEIPRSPSCLTATVGRKIKKQKVSNSEKQKKSWTIYTIKIVNGQHEDGAEGKLFMATFYVCRRMFIFALSDEDDAQPGGALALCALIRNTFQRFV
jgi:hypothetical protein